MSRIKKLETHYHERLKEKDIKDISEFIQSILDADITKGKYARFLIESFLNDKFLEEDLMGGLDSTVGKAISLFDKHKGKLPINKRSVYALDEETGETLYQSPGDLWNSVKQFQNEKSGKKLKKEEQEKIYRETEFIYKDEETGFQIVSPLTEESAQWWGKGTRWCTSADNNNMFERYASLSPLFILLMPTSANTAGNSDKLQLWKNGNEVQFMDEADSAVSLDYIEKHWTILEPICMWLNHLKFIPDRYITKELCEMIIKSNVAAIQYVPDRYITKELYEMIVRSNVAAIQYINDRYKTKELCELAIQQSGKVLGYIPHEHRTRCLCELAVKQDGMSIKYTPKHFRIKSLCELAIKQNGSALYYISKELRTQELCELAVQQNGMALQYVPDRLKTPELCELAVKQDGYALQYIPEELKTPELCELAVKQDGMALQYVPEELRTEELCKLAVKQDGWTLKYVPEKLRIKELCELAVKQNGFTLQCVPEELRTEEVCKLAVQKNGDSLSYVPEELKTYKLCELAVKQSEYALQYVPEELRTEELCNMVIRQNIDAEQSVPENFKDKTIGIQINLQKYIKQFSEIQKIFPNNALSLNIN